MPWAIGACAWIFGNRPLVALAADLFNWGYDGLELSGEPEQYDSADVRQVLKDSGLGVLGGTASCNWPTDARDLANPDPAVRSRAGDHFGRCLVRGRRGGEGGGESPQPIRDAPQQYGGVGASVRRRGGVPDRRRCLGRLPHEH